MIFFSLHITHINRKEGLTPSFLYEDIFIYLLAIWFQLFFYVVKPFSVRIIHIM